MAHAQSRARPDIARCGARRAGAAGPVGGAPARVVDRARIVLLAADGLTGAAIAQWAGCTEPMREDRSKGPYIPLAVELEP